MPFRVIVLTMAVLSASIACADADDASPNSSPPPVAPIQLSCALTSSILGRSAAARMGAITVTFKNISSQTMKSVHYDILDSGVDKGDSSDVGSFAPGVVVSYKKVLGSEIAPLTDPDGLTCSVSDVVFEDGTTWHPTLGKETIVSQPDAPIAIQHCSVSNMATTLGSSTTPGYNLLVTLSFENKASQAASVAKFRIDLFDAFDTLLESVAGTVQGHFANGAVIEPTRNANGYIYSPSSPAWRYLYGAGATDVAESRCSVEDVRFEDGSIWRAPPAQ